MSGTRRRKDRATPAVEKINPPMTEAEFDQLFHDVSNWGRWGEADERGTLNYLTPEHVRKAALSCPLRPVGVALQGDRHGYWPSTIPILRST